MEGDNSRRKSSKQVKISTEKKRKLTNDKKKEGMRRLREAIKRNPERYEEYKRRERERYQKRKQEGKIKSITELSDREKRVVRKNWRIRSKKSYDTKKALGRNAQQLLTFNTPPHTPPSTPLPNNFEVISESHIVQTPTMSNKSNAGKKRSRHNRGKLKLKIANLETKLKREKTKKEKYKKRLQRLQIGKNSPKTKVNNMLRGQLVSPNIRRKLLLGEVLCEQIKENYGEQSNANAKKSIVTAVSGALVRKYKFTQHVKTLTSSRVFRRKFPKKQTGFQRLRAIVRTFYENDESSRICPGKKETLTFRKIKKQKRYLNYSLKELHAKFKESHPDYQISYAFFCKLRPFWVVSLKVQNRDTCLCDTHTNFELIVSKLKKLSIIKEVDGEQVIRSLTCTTASSKYEESCLKRECLICKDKKIVLFKHDKNELTNYQQWLTKSEKLMIRGQEKIVKKKTKESIECTKKQLVDNLLSAIPKFFLHTLNMLHQYKAIKYIKKNLSPHDILIHADFSENYACKYSEEIQSAHFGGSKPQITLHTVVVYLASPEGDEPAKISYCSVSKSLKHDPSAICAHITPILIEAKRTLGTFRTVHFLTDGPSTQYKNKSMFYFMTILANMYEMESLHWHYFESHHGKGAPDGIGGYVKRMADSFVSRGQDIPNFETFIDKLNTLQGIKILPIDESSISEFNKKLPLKLRVFKGTQQVHEVVWSKIEPHTLRFRKLSCSCCSENQVCSHYDLGALTHSHEDKESILFN